MEFFHYTFSLAQQIVCAARWILRGWNRKCSV